MSASTLIKGSMQIDGKTAAGDAVPSFATVLVSEALLNRERRSIYKEEQLARNLLDSISKAAEESRSSQGATIGRRPHPFSFEALRNFQTSNVHHATCINTKVSATVGLGFVQNTSKGTKEDLKKAAGQPAPSGQTPGGRQLDPSTDPIRQARQSKADEILDPLCNYSFMDVLQAVAEDFVQCGNGYLEVVRLGPGGEITGLHHIPGENVYIYLEDDMGNMHYEVCSSEGTSIGRKMASFGDSEAFFARQKKAQTLGTGAGDGASPVYPADPEAAPAVVSEVIHFRSPSSINRWYGFPKWLAAITSIELSQCLVQFKYDFFLNRGVPEFLLFFLGKRMDPKDWSKVQTAMQAHIGLGQSHKTLAMNITDENMKVQLEKLAMEGQGLDDGFDKIDDILGLKIVSAHRVPPLLAGIVTPGKIGAANELPNALMSFQLLAVGPDQRVFHQTFSKTLGNPDLNGGLDLKAEDFVLKRITDEMNMNVMNTVGSMRQTLPEAQAQGRDLTAGVKE